MKSTSRPLCLDGIDLTVVRKDVKHVRIRVHSHTGQVVVSAPRRLGDDALRRMLAPKVPWIARKQAEARVRTPQVPPEYVTGEEHLYAGRSYRLLVTEGPGRSSVDLCEGQTLALHVRAGATREQRKSVLERWYRQELTERAQSLVAEWQPALGVRAAEVRVRRMKTRWGSCNTKARRVWLNLELIKRPDACLEYVVVHELVHLLEPSHNARFWRLMDGFMPQWRRHRDALKKST